MHQSTNKDNKHLHVFIIHTLLRPDHLFPNEPGQLQATKERKEEISSVNNQNLADIVSEKCINHRKLIKNVFLFNRMDGGTKL